MTKNYVRLDKVAGTAHYESVVSADAPIVAGQFITLGTVLDESEGETVDFKKAEEGKAFDAVTCPVYLDKGYPAFNLVEQEVPAGKPARALHPGKGTIISVLKEMAPGVVKGDKVAVGVDGFGFKKAAAGTGDTAGDVVAGTVIAEEYLGNIGDVVVVRF